MEQQKYSREELEEFRVLILEKLEAAKEQYRSLVGSVRSGEAEDCSDTAHTFNPLEAAADVAGQEDNARLARRQADFIRSLQQALVRIDLGTYGICRKTGRLIPKERLRLVPHATLSADAKLQR